MTRLERVLSDYAVRGKMGPRERGFDREHLRTALAAAGRGSAMMFWVAVSAQFAVLIFAIWMAAVNASNPTVLAAVVVGTGGGLAAASFQLVRLWKEKVATDLVMALAGSLKEDAALSVLQVVLEPLRKEGPSAKG